MNDLTPLSRREYQRGTLRRKDLDPDPIKQFEKWFTESLQDQSADPHAMTVATADSKGRPSARTVLLKKFDDSGFVFCTQYTSRKGKELSENPAAAILFYWPLLERQVQIRGAVSRVSREESEKYFNERPEGSRLAALTSAQSEVVANREILDARFEKMSREYQGKKIPLPANWGGYLLKPETIEFWQGGVNRLHDRFQYRRENSSWIIERLSS